MQRRWTPHAPGFAVVADDFQTIKVVAERDNSNVVHCSRLVRGGAGGAELVVGDIRAFFGTDLGVG